RPSWIKQIFGAQPRVEITSEKAHTGVRSLAVHGDVAFRQIRLQPQTGTYVLSAWVSRKNTDVTTYAAPSGTGESRRLGVGLVIGGSTTDAGDVSGGGTVLFEPTGPIIDGWQRVDG